MAPVPVDETASGLGADDFGRGRGLSVRSGDEGTARRRVASAFFAKIGGDAVGDPERLTRTCTSAGRPSLDSIRDAEGVSHEAVSAPVSLDGVMVPLQAGEDGRPKADGAVMPAQASRDARGERTAGSLISAHAESGKVTLAARRRMTRQLRRTQDRRYRRPPTGWTFPERPCRPKPRSSTSGIACEHLRTVRPCGGLRVREHRGVLVTTLWRETGDPGVAPPS